MKRPFDGNVKVGELRIFADLDRPVVALIVEDRGAFGFRIIPVSDFTNVSCEGEQLVGGRVYQHWNACGVPRSFASRSWLVATLPHPEFSLIHSSTSTSHFNYSTYRRTFLFSVPGVLGRHEESSRRSSPSFVLRSSFRRAAGFAIAAGLLFALVFAVRLDLDRATHREEKAHAWNLVLKPNEPEALQAVADEAVESDPVEVAGNAPKFVIAPPDDAKMASEPEIRGKVAAPMLVKVEPAGPKPEASLDKVDVAVMRGLSRKTTKEHAIAVMTYLACGVNANDKEFGAKLTESTERLVESARSLDIRGDEYVQRLVATALCRVYAATKNPDLKESAESALDSLGDKRAVEIVARGYDLIEDWFASRGSSVSAAPDRVAAPIVYPDWFRFLKSHKD